jgi:hypothetical protein
MKRLWPVVGLLAALTTTGAAPTGGAPTVRLDWADGWLYASGYAPASAHDQDLGVHRAARLAAESEALAAVERLQVTADATVKAFASVSEDIASDVAALVHGARMVSQGPVGDPPRWQVTIGVPLRSAAHGESSLAQILLPRLAALQAKAVAAQKRMDHEKSNFRMMGEGDAPKGDEPSAPPPPTKALPPRRPGPYTGLVLDTTGFHLQACMCPKIMRRDGSEIWGTVDVPPPFVLEHGIAGFVYDLDVALGDQGRTRVGDNPLVLRAVGRQGAVWANAILNDADASLLAAENANSRFLDKFAVEFVIDE